MVAFGLLGFCAVDSVGLCCVCECLALFRCGGLFGLVCLRCGYDICRYACGGC